MRKIVVNLKMNFDFFEVRSYAQEVNKIITGNPEVILCPSYPYLGLFQSSAYALGAQDVSEFIEGDYTGSVSARQLASLNVKYVIIGHSERKKFQAETPEVIINKIRNAVKNKLKVILCFSETKDDKKTNRGEFLVRKLLAEVFNKLNKDELNSIIVAYDPEWAQDTAITPLIKDIDSMTSYIKKEIYDHYKIATEVIYGGGINSININELVKLSTVSGFMLGKSSLNLKELNDILIATKEKI